MQRIMGAWQSSFTCRRIPPNESEGDAAIVPGVGEGNNETEEIQDEQSFNC